MLFNMNIKKIIKNYQEAFNRQDIDKLSSLFDSKVRLHDWDINVIGKKRVLDANKKIFKNVKNIKCIPVQTIISGKIAVCEVLIIADKEKINVVDLIRFNKRNKIISIKAFKI